MAIKTTILFVTILLITSLAARAQETNGSAPNPSVDATTAIRLLLADPDFATGPALAENAYDFATGAGIPGFGPLDAAEGERRLAHLIWE
jgi:hypothetical protein